MKVQRLGKICSALGTAVYVISTIVVVSVGSPVPVSAEGECPDGFFPTRISPNPVVNGNFSTTLPLSDVNPVGPNLGRDNTTTYHYVAGGFWSQAANVGNDIYPADIDPQRNQFSLQDGPFDGGPNNELHEVYFPGDTTYDVDQETTWFYSNGNALGDGVNTQEYVNWGQRVTGLDPLKVYVFVAYINNLVELPYDAVDDPTMWLRVGGAPGLPDGQVILGPDRLLESETSNLIPPLAGWKRIAATFLPEADGSKVLKITDTSTGYNGDDFAITAVTVQVCDPIAVGNAWKPIMRTYGNETLAGGGFYDPITGTCPNPSAQPTSGSFVKGFGRYVPAATQNHSTYSGSGSEQAIFATGDITGVLPGAQTNLARAGGLWALSFANTVGNTNAGLYGYGGQFGTVGCTDFPAFPSVGDPGVIDLSVAATSGPIDLAAYTPTPGEYTFIVTSGAIRLAGTTIPAGVHIKLYVTNATNDNGEVSVLGNIRYAGTGSWGSISDIPLLQVFANGGLLIRENVTEISGIYKAKGMVHTCIADNGTVLFQNGNPADLPGNEAHAWYILSHCNEKLTVYGSIIAGDGTYLYRVSGRLADAQVAEEYTSSNLAEAFVFSPEVYLALLSAEGGYSNTVGAFDSVIVLPPSL